MRIEENKPLAPFTTFGIGGPARWFVEAGSEDEIVEAIGWARERGVALFVLGGGSNLLVSDTGFDGLVLRIGLRGTEVSPATNAPANEDSRRGGLPSGAKAHDDEGHGTYGLKPVPFTPQPLSSTSVPAAFTRGDVHQMVYRVAAGEDWDGFVERTVRDSCAGIECLAGIPGTVGGTPVQNVGAYGQEVSSTIGMVRAFDLREGVFHEFTNAECEFAYRRSRFNTSDRGRYIVTRVDYYLRPGGAPTLHYTDLQRAVLENRPAGGEPSLVEVAAVVRRVRQTKGMLLVEGDPDCRSAGSFFKNPVVSDEQAAQIAAVVDKEPPRFPAGAGKVKLPAAWLIEQAGFIRGYARGRAAISSRHTLALINLGETGGRGGASAAEVLALADQIKAAVEARFGIQLEMEPVLVGF
jgi:UDP-N-acetylmuramate dehydrogenase